MLIHNFTRSARWARNLVDGVRVNFTHLPRRAEDMNDDQNTCVYTKCAYSPLPQLPHLPPIADNHQAHITI